MIKQVFNVEDYWKVIVYYNIDYNLFDEIEFDLYNAQASNETIISIYNNMSRGKTKAVTFNNTELCRSIVTFNKHKTKYDYINSIIHEAEHIKQGMLKAYDVKDAGEPPAYTIGYLVMKMYVVFQHLLV
jgi:hypothetical protein